MKRYIIEKGCKTKKDRMSFFWTFFLSSALFVACVIGLYGWLGRSDHQDQMAYQKLMEDQEGSIEKRGYTSRQKRMGLQKDIVFMQKNGLLNMHLKSASAELAFDHRHGQTEIIEQMNEVTCYLQEDLYFKLPGGIEAAFHEDGRFLLKGRDPKDSASWIPGNIADAQAVQVVRLLEAQTAYYYYKNDLLVAETVKLSRYGVSGHSMKDALNGVRSNLMSGTAAWVEFSLKEKRVNFKAYQFQATVKGL